MQSVEEAHDAVGTALWECALHGWERIVFKTVILSKNCSSMETVRLENGAAESIGLGMRNGFAVSDAIILLRDQLLDTTGARIWGLTFTLFPDGKFKIEYDYNKPDGYEEGDETIDLSQAIENLQSEGLKVEKE